MKKILSTFLAFVILFVSMPEIVSAENIDNAKLVIDTVNVFSEEIFEVDVKLENNPGIVAANLEVSFDDELTLIGVGNGDVFPSTTTFIPPKQLETDGEISSNCRLVWQGFDIKDSEIKNGIIVTLKFKMSENVTVGNTYQISISSSSGDVIDKNLNPVLLNGQCLVNVKDNTKTRNIADTVISKISDVEYTGMAITPSITITDEQDGVNSILSKDDYKVEYLNNVDAGEATVVIKGTGNYSGEVRVTFIINKASASIVTLPVAKQGLVYNGQAQVLLTAGVSTGGNLVYCFDRDGEYTEAIPAGKETGTYTVWYKVKGDNNHKDTEPNSVQVTIAAKQDGSNNTQTYLESDGTQVTIKTDTKSNGIIIVERNEIKPDGTVTNSITTTYKNGTKTEKKIVSNVNGTKVITESTIEPDKDAIMVVTDINKDGQVTQIANFSDKNGKISNAKIYFLSETGLILKDDMQKSQVVTVPDTITANGKIYKVTSIADNAYKGNTKLKSIVIGKNITQIGKRAFYKCKNLKQITIKGKLKKVGKQAFKGIKKNAQFKIKASQKNYKKIVVLIKKCTEKNVKYKRMK